MDTDIKKVKEFCKKAKISTGLMKLAEENIKEFKLKADECKGERFLGTMMADSNLGGDGSGNGIRNTESAGIECDSEINAWRAQFQVAEDLAAKLGVEPTNLVLMYLAHHPKASKAWEKCCK